MLEVRNLTVSIAGTRILDGLDLTVRDGEVAAIMGPNGTGKSTLAYVIAGKEDYEVESGEILVDGADILEKSPDERVADGVNKLRSAKRSFLVITHYQRLLNYIVPDTVHVMSGGRIVRTGGKELALELEQSGYRDFAVKPADSQALNRAASRAAE